MLFNTGWIMNENSESLWLCPGFQNSNVYLGAQIIRADQDSRKSNVQSYPNVSLFDFFFRGILMVMFWNQRACFAL